jgi:uracil-DNA glycosylase
MKEDNLSQAIDALNQEVFACRRCKLGESRTKAVPGDGCLTANIMFIGEAPGATEDKQGVPFCGKAGKVLDELLAVAGLKRRDIFIANILKCRPANNRNPNTQEIEKCTPYLDRQLELIKPQIICCLGNFAANYIMTKFNLAAKVQGISKIHGKIFISQASYGRIKIIPLFHPAVVTYDMSKKPVLENDFTQLKFIPPGPKASAIAG